jgi:hypothetical protein
MARMRINTKLDLSGLKAIQKQVPNLVEQAMHDCVDDLVRTSSETAPHWKGDLEKSHAKDVRRIGDTRVEGTVEYAVKAKNGYNYAIRMHEDTTYNLGEKSLQKGGGVGMSGKHYEVGHHFLTRPLEGEAQTYQNHIGEAVKKALQ